MARRIPRAEAGRCSVCGMLAIHGLVVMGRPLCSRCEELVTSTDCGSEVYSEVLSRVKSLWSGRLSLQRGKAWR